MTMNEPRVASAKPAVDSAEAVGADHDGGATLVAAISGLLFPVWLFATLMVAESYKGDTPGVDEPSAELIPFLRDNFLRIRVVAAMSIVGWIILLVFLTSLVRVTSRHIDLVSTVSVALAAAGAAVAVAGQAAFASPTLVWELNRDNLAQNLDPGVARWLLFAGEVSGIAAGMLVGAALVALAILFMRSRIYARRFLGVTALVLGAGGLLTPVFGGGGSLIEPLIPWAIVTAILLLVSRRRPAV